MTKKHFKAFADYIKTVDVGYTIGEEQEIKEQLAKMVIDVAKQFNGRFDRERFLAAAGIGN